MSSAALAPPIAPPESAYVLEELLNVTEFGTEMPALTVMAVSARAWRDLYEKGDLCRHMDRAGIVWKKQLESRDV
jgi:hypothetical protein